MSQSQTVSCYINTIGFAYLSCFIIIVADYVSWLWKKTCLEHVSNVFFLTCLVGTLACFSGDGWLIKVAETFHYWYYSTFLFLLVVSGTYSYCKSMCRVFSLTVVSKYISCIFLCHPLWCATLCPLIFHAPLSLCYVCVETTSTDSINYTQQL